MKTVSSLFKNLQAFSFLTGMAFGACISIVLFSYLVPGGLRAITYRYMKMPTYDSIRNQHEIKMLTGTYAHGRAMNHTMGDSAGNPYMMSTVTSEMQFLEDMKLHHEAAVVMATQVLALPGIHKEVADLAKAIVSTQTEEIKNMSNWIQAWK